MRRYQFAELGLTHLKCVETEPPAAGPGEVAVSLRAFSLNYRDLLVVKGTYNPRIALPATPVSDGAGVVKAVGDGVTEFKEGDRVMSHFVADWIDGPFQSSYVTSTLGVPGPGLAAEEVVLKAKSLLALPDGYDFDQACTLPIAALTAWSVLVTEGRLQKGQTVLTLGTGGVSLFALQLAKAMGARVIVTSSSDEKLERVRQMGADVCVNYREVPRWDKEVLRATEGRGADIVVENGGIATLSHSLKATAGGGTVGLLGALTGLAGEVNIAPVLMKRIKIAGILVDSRSAFLDLVRFIEGHRIEPIIDRRFPFVELKEALQHMAEGRHFGKIVVTVPR